MISNLLKFGVIWQSELVMTFFSHSLKIRNSFEQTVGNA